jgi:peptidoglycan/xylan/chitin deacetylase (PgdA/CDA1 family)
VFSWLLRKIATHWSHEGKQTKLNILTYHRVGERFSDKNPKSIHWALFALQIKWLNKYFNILPLPIALELQAKNELPPRAICITIDDGYRDSYDYIFKTLQQEKVKAAFFISTQGLTKGGLWDEDIYVAIFNAPEEIKQLNIDGKFFDMSSFERRVETRYQLTEETKYLPLAQRQKIIEEIRAQTGVTIQPNEFLSADQIRKMHSAGMTIGAHTHSHPILLKESDSVAFNEIKQSKVILEDILGQSIDYFAYPNGKFEQDFSQCHIEMVESLGFQAALSTDWGSLANYQKDRFKIKRFTPWDKTEYKFIFRLALNYRKS